MQPLIRQATEGDIASILPLWHELIEHHSRLDTRFRLVPDAADRAETHLRAELAAPTSLLAVAEHDAAVVAYCRASVRQPSPIFEPRAYGFISEFHVVRSLRRQGIGRNLLQYVRTWFGEQGVARLELVTLDANEDSNPFWQSMGCVPYARNYAAELR